MNPLVSLRRLMIWSVSAWVLFVGVLIGLLLLRHLLLTPWLGSSIGDFLVLVCLLAFVCVGSRIVVKKLKLKSNIRSLLLTIGIWTGLSVISDLVLHRFFSVQDWNSIFGSSILVQTDFWIVLIFCEIVGPFLVIWLLKSK